MPFLARHEIDPKIREPYEARHKRHLREALLVPGLSAAQRKHIQKQIRSVGQPKVYSADSPPKAGAFKAPFPRVETLQRMKKAELIALAENLSLSTEGSKTEILDRILAVVI